MRSLGIGWVSATKFLAYKRLCSRAVPGPRQGSSRIGLILRPWTIGRIK